ncbi:conserved hypothetical protein [Candida albicans WO-1]|uniref:Uncharacterized protein n=2 Tax=Candida albicans TaxID=5476 RepID=Q5A844_CANAL|nr:uncharacterized protein CAALFM_CR00720WA [Candida albicans SC5314]AOW30840.1 hypothetical protein CAALFM_CR00720WA [Candida albicans SC5314]EEQ43203.1 conserved hypothetical protein [Candida albicans WO-1]|eukprot:XP_717974.1 hypothetical protein CAALFM_CR00720WA [Candida albicans SC5314]
MHSPFNFVSCNILIASFATDSTRTRFISAMTLFPISVSLTNPGINALILIFPLNSFDRLLVNPNKPALDAAYTEVPGIKCSVIDNTEEIFNIVGSDPFWRSIFFTTI